MGGYTALLIFFAILFIIGGFIPLIVQDFVKTNIANTDSYMLPIVNLLSKGITIDLPLLSPFELDFLFFVPKSIKNFIINQFVAFSYLPGFLSVPLLIILFFSFIFVVASFIPTISGG